MPTTTRTFLPACLLLLAVAACGTGRVEPAPETVTLERADFAITVTGAAELRARRETTVHCGVEGKSTVIQLVPEGVAVKQGEILVEFDASGLRDKRAEQALALARAEGALARAETDPERAALEAELSIRTQRMEHLDAQIRRAVVRAPIPGHVVHERGIREGAVVRERQPLLRLSDVGSLQARVHMPQDDQARVEVGQRATVRADALPDLDLSGRVAAIEPPEGPGQGWVIVDLGNGATELRPFMSATVAIEVDRLRDVLTLPVQCVRLSDDSATVWRQTAGMAEPVAVELGAGDGTRVVVRGGLAAGDRILLAPPGSR